MSIESTPSLARLRSCSTSPFPENTDGASLKRARSNTGPAVGVSRDMATRGLIGIMFCLGFAVSCAHPNRVSRATVNRLTKSHEGFVLVYGSLLPAQGASHKPVLRFVHQVNKSAPNYILHQMTVTKTDRFYAILKPPVELKRVDQFETEVSWGQGYDKINFVRVAEQRGGTAIYLGEIQMMPAERRDAPGRGIAVTVRDDFDAVTREFRQLYPGFDGKIIKGPMGRSQQPAADPPKRVK